MSTPFRLPKLVGRKHVVASAVQEIPQFECNKLHVEKHIGRGSFGEVFLTEFRNTDKEPAEKFVVKCMLEMQDEEDTKRFIKEVRIINKLKHPNIVEFRRVCFAPCALMMEYMCFSFLPFGSGSDISVSSLQDFLLRINDQDCFGFEDVVRHAGTEIGKLLISHYKLDARIYNITQCASLKSAKVELASDSFAQPKQHVQCLVFPRLQRQMSRNLLEDKDAENTKRSTKVAKQIWKDFLLEKKCR